MRFNFVIGDIIYFEAQRSHFAFTPPPLNLVLSHDTKNPYACILTRIFALVSFSNLLQLAFHHPIPLLSYTNLMAKSPSSSDTSNSKVEEEKDKMIDENQEKTTPFVNDPVRTLGTLPLSTDQIADLDGPNFLSTPLVDFILQQLLKDSIPQHVLIGSSNSMSFLELANSKVKDGTYPLQRSVSRMRESYSAYSKGRYRFLAATCSQAHFFVVDVTFNLEHS